MTGINVTLQLSAPLPLGGSSNCRVGRNYSTCRGVETPPPPSKAICNHYVFRGTFVHEHKPADVEHYGGAVGGLYPAKQDETCSLDRVCAAAEIPRAEWKQMAPAPPVRNNTKPGGGSLCASSLGAYLCFIEN